MRAAGGELAGCGRSGWQASAAAECGGRAAVGECGSEVAAGRGWSGRQASSAAGASGCYSTTTLFGALAASFALSFFLITIFICPQALYVARRRPHDNGEVSDTAASVECAVYLSTVDVGEKVRQLLAHGYVFHQECIDMWLSSHASCPVCRGKAAPADKLADAIAACISMTPDVVVPASSPASALPAARRRLAAVLTHRCSAAELARRPLRRRASSPSAPPAARRLSARPPHPRVPIVSPLAAGLKKKREKRGEEKKICAADMWVLCTFF
uniref:RING-type E3 ubiquitin transferase n=1 Tax=Oryza sativa subsp. japonica TaxID=39947 RepID=Q69UB0_ORYSJ|nr:hypothetical protein [Oryza sativa Japonica Group]